MVSLSESAADLKDNLADAAKRHADLLDQLQVLSHSRLLLLVSTAAAAYGRFGLRNDISVADHEHLAAGHAKAIGMHQ